MWKAWNAHKNANKKNEYPVGENMSLGEFEAEIWRKPFSFQVYKN
jgi:hypothetical protein